MSKEFISTSGKKIVINCASFEASQALWCAVQKAAADQNLFPDSIKEPESLFNLILRIDSSESFRNALWACLIRCTRDDKKIEKSTFEDKEARTEYYEIIVPCVEENIGPFVESLFSELSAYMTKLSQKIPSDTPKP